MGLKFVNLVPAGPVVAGLLLGMTLAAPAAPFVAGADFSHLAYFESRGVAYKDGGQVRDGLQILKDHGINCVRLRLFTSSAAQAAANPYNYINNTAYTVPLAVRVKNAGLLFCLDFHYSDTWADAGHQLTPAAWFSLTFPQMVQQMRTYNSNTIAAFAAAGAMPDYVQIGNEITQGMLFTNSAGATIGKVSGSYNTSWNQLGQLMKAAVQGIQDAALNAGETMPKIIVHIDRGGDWATTMWFFDNLNYQGVPYDIIGESYYPFYHGDPANLSICLSNAAVALRQTHHRRGNRLSLHQHLSHRLEEPAFWLPPTTQGQVDFIAALATIVKGLPNQLGAGIFYWGTEYQAVSGVNEAGFNTASFFAADGNVLPVADGVGGMAAPLLLKPSLKGANLQLQWPFSGAASRLTTSTTLTLATAWPPVPDPVQTTGAVFTVFLTVAPGQNHFYRLQSN